MPTNEEHLLSACKNGKAKIVQALLQKPGINVNQADEGGRTPLQIACVKGHLKIVKLLLEKGGQDVNQADKDGWTLLQTACVKGHLKIAQVLLDHGVENVDKANDGGRTALHHACFRGHVNIVQALLARGANANLRDRKGRTPLYQACLQRYPKVVQELVKHGVDVNEVYEFNRGPLYLGCLGGDPEVVRVLLANGAKVNVIDDIGVTLLHLVCAPNGLVVTEKAILNIVQQLFEKGAVNQANEDGVTPLHNACRRKHLKVIQAFLALDGIEVNQADGHGVTPLHEACKAGSLKVVQALLAKGAQMDQADENGWTPFQRACSQGHIDIVRVLWDKGAVVNIDAKSYGSIEAHQQEYGTIVDAFTKDYLIHLRQEIEHNPDRLFDFPQDDEGHQNTEKALMGYYVLRHLIRCSEVNDLSQLVNDVNIQESMELLLNIPSVKALVIANATSTDLPANYLRLGSRKFSSQTNELLRIAQSVGIEAIAARLLDIPAIREVAEANNFYQGVRGVNLAEMAHDRESSMRALTPEEQESVQRIKEEYQATIKAQRGVSKVIKQLKETLKAKYFANQADRTITLDDIDYSLPFEWDELQKLIKDNDFTEKQKEAIIQGYYQNVYHTAYRYLSKPNHWMSERAGWVNVNPITGARWSTFEEYLPLIAYLWTAANDEARPPTEANVSVADRVDLFIRQIAFINRAHNWDDYRDVLDAEGNAVVDADGNPLREEYDDLEEDKPSCFSGVKKRLFQSLLHHPLYTPLDKAIVTQFVNESVRAYFRGVLLSYPVDRLETIDNAIGDYFVFGEDEDDENTYPKNKALVEALMLPDGFTDTVKERLAAQYGPKRVENFDSQLDELVAPQEPLVANDFLRFYNSAALEQLLEQTLLLAPVTQHLQPIIDVAAVNYLFAQAQPETKADFNAFNALVRNVQQYGVSRIWEAIEEEVKENYLALEGVDATEVNWQGISPLLQTLHLTQGANNLIHDELFRAARNSVGYRAYSKQGGEGGSRTSFWTAPAEKREIQWTLWDCVRAAAMEHDRASRSDDARKGEVAEFIKDWWQLDEAALAKEVYQYLKKGHGGWSKNSFKAQLGWYVFNKLGGKGLKDKQARILNEAPINGEKIRHHCNYMWSASHREDALNQLLRAFTAEFLAAAPVAAPVSRQDVGLV